MLVLVMGSSFISSCYRSEKDERYFNLIINGETGLEGAKFIRFACG